MRPGEPILLLCHSFPPVPGIGGRRWAKFAKELAHRGHPVHVIRSEKREGSKESLWSADVDHPLILHHPIRVRYPAIMSQSPITSLADKIHYHVSLWRLKLQTKGNFYDQACLSGNDVLSLATKLIQERGIRHVIATGAPFHYLVFAAQLKSKFPELHLTVDFRDEWTWTHHYGFTYISPTRQEVERNFEAQVIGAADQVITPHQYILDHLRSSYPNKLRNECLLPHTIDPASFPPLADAPSDGIFRMAYAGSLYHRGEADQYMKALFAAFMSLRAQAPEKFAKTHFDLFVTGGQTEDYVRQCRALGLSEQIRFHKPASSAVVLGVLAKADLNPVFIPDDKKDLLVTKFHELFMLRRPILHIGTPGLVSRTLIERRLGASVRVDELATELPRIIMGQRQIEVDLEADHSEYLLSKVTDRLLSEVLQADGDRTADQVESTSSTRR